MSPKKASRRSPVPPRRPRDFWQLRLYVMHETPKLVTALKNLKLVCESRLKDRYRIRVIDLLKQPQLARGDQILATPTVVRRLPTPMRTVIDNLSDFDNVLVGLDPRAGALTGPIP